MPKTDVVLVTNTVTGEIKTFSGTMMVAPNGMVFIKSGKEVVWCSASRDFVAEKQYLTE